MQSTVSPPVEQRHQQSLRILLVEDNLVNQRVALRILEKQGHTVVVVGDGQAALTTLAQASFDLVLMDIQMPVLDGLAATAAIRAQEQTRGTHVPIIAMTAHAMRGDYEQCLAVGMDGYVTKPIKATDLTAAIAQVLPRCSRHLRGRRLSTCRQLYAMSREIRAYWKTCSRRSGRVIPNS